MPSPDPRVLVEGYGGDQWLSEHYREIERLEERWQPYAYYRPRPFHGSTIGVGPDGLRDTWQPPVNADRVPHTRPRQDPDARGLVTLGFRRETTIRSRRWWLARLTCEACAVELRNMAQIGYVSTQELMALVVELQAGYRPDIVVFYDGVNDTTSAYLGREAGLTTNESNRRREFNLLQSPARLAAALTAKLIKDSGSYRSAQGRPAPARGRGQGSERPVRDDIVGPARRRHVASRYAANIKIVETLSRGYGFRPLFFWQPIVFTKPALVPVEARRLCGMPGPSRCSGLSMARFKPRSN